MGQRRCRGRAPPASLLVAGRGPGGEESRDLHGAVPAALLELAPALRRELPAAGIHDDTPGESGARAGRKAVMSTGRCPPPASSSPVSFVVSCLPSESRTTSTGIPCSIGLPYLAFTSAFRFTPLRVFTSTSTTTKAFFRALATAGSPSNVEWSLLHQMHQFAPRSTITRLCSAAAWLSAAAIWAAPSAWTS